MVLPFGFPVMLVARSPIYLANCVTDMRKSIDGLSLLAEQHFNRNPASGAYYVFCNRARNKLKVLYWDTNGFALWYKRLEKSRFKLNYTRGAQLSLTEDQFQWLLSGLPIDQRQGRKALNYSVFS